MIENTPDTIAAHTGLDVFVRDELFAKFYNDADFVKSIVDVFVEDAPGMLRAVRDAVESGDAEALFQRAHAIKGMIGNMIEGKAYKAAYELEMAGRGAELDQAGPALQNLTDNLDSLMASLKEIRQTI